MSRERCEQKGTWRGSAGCKPEGEFPPVKTRQTTPTTTATQPARQPRPSTENPTRRIHPGVHLANKLRGGCQTRHSPPGMNKAGRQKEALTPTTETPIKPRLTLGLAALLSTMLAGCEGSDNGIFGLGGNQSGAHPTSGRSTSNADDDEDEDGCDDEDDDEDEEGYDEDEDEDEGCGDDEDED